MATQTTNYNLTKPAASDYYDVEDFNGNADIIDAALKDLQDKKADLDESGKVPASQLPSTVNVDSALSDTSVNPVENKAITGALAKKADLDGDGKLKSEQLPDGVPTGDTIGQPGGTASLGADGKVPASQLPDISSVGATTATLYSSGWTLGSDERYYQTVPAAGVTTAAAQVVWVDAALTGTDLDADAEVLSAWQEPSGHNVVQGTGTLTFYAYTAPEINIPINVGVA